jgi:hypothetical protein
MNLRTDLIDIVRQAVKESERGGALVASDILSGFSGEKIIGLLQRLARGIEPLENICYVEIGVFQGLTLLSVALAAPKLKAYGIDNFCQFDSDEKNKQLILERQHRLSLRSVSVIDCDYDEAMRRFQEFAPEQKIGLLFVDGPHDYRSQLLSILLALPHLAEGAVIVVDDCNYEHVRLATRDLLVIDPMIKLVFEAYTPAHPLNIDIGQDSDMRFGWWNGIHVLVRAAATAPIRGLIPQTGKARQRCEQEHVLHAHAADVCRRELYELAYDLATGPTIGKLLEAWRLLGRFRQKIRHDRLYRTGNTYTAEITGETIDLGG